jgi:tetrahydrodipicolinate N-succinyltransferase
VIGHDVWIGMNAIILPGATIGNGVIVGAGAWWAALCPTMPSWPATGRGGENAL